MKNRLKRRLGLATLLLIITMLLATVIPQPSLAQDTGVADNEFTFVVTSDMHGYTGSTYDTSQYFRGVCEKISALSGSSFMVSPGDLDPPSNVNWTIDKYLGQDYLWYPGVGNHNVDTSDMAWLRSYNYDPNGATPPNIVNTGPPNGVATTYSFDYENSHFVMLNEYYNGSSDTGTDGDIVDALYNWLAADLNATAKAHIFIFGHEPAYPQPDVDNGVLRHKGDSLDKYTVHRDRFWNLLKSKNVVAYIHGHTHCYSAVNISGVWQLDTGHSMGKGNTQTRSTFIMIHVDGDMVTYDAYRDNYNGGPYTLVYSGMLTSAPQAPSLSVTVSAPSLTNQSNFTVQATVTNSGDQTATGVTATITLPSGSGLSTADSTKSLGNIAGKASAGASWTVTSTVDGTYAIKVAADATNAYLASGTAMVTVDTRPPALSSIVVVNITGSSADITWTTDESSDSQVDYGISSGLYTSSIDSGQMVTSHKVTLANLQASTLYYFQVTSVDSVGNESVSGERSFNTSSSPPPGFSISVSPSSRTVYAGWGTTYTVKLTALNGYNLPVKLTVTGLPGGATGTFSKNPVTPTSGGASSTLSVSTRRYQKGTYTLTITGIDTASTTHSTIVTLRIR